MARRRVKDGQLPEDWYVKSADVSRLACKQLQMDIVVHEHEVYSPARAAAPPAPREGPPRCVTACCELRTRSGQAKVDPHRGTYSYCRWLLGSLRR